MTLETTFNRLTAKLEELTKLEVERRSEWTYMNFKRTVTFGAPDKGIYATFVYPFKHTQMIQQLSESVSVVKINLFWYEFSKNKLGDLLKCESKLYEGNGDQPLLFQYRTTQNSEIPILTKKDDDLVKRIVKEGRLIHSD